MITANEVLRNLRKLIGQELNYDDVICSFEGFKEGEVYVGKSNNNGYDYIAYINAEEGTQFLIDVKRIYNEEPQNLEIEVIEDVWVA